MMHIKKYYENITNDEIPTKRYTALEISPVHIHKNKKCHKDAILTLGDEIVTTSVQSPAAHDGGRYPGDRAGQGRGRT